MERPWLVPRPESGLGLGLGFGLGLGLGLGFGLGLGLGSGLGFRVWLRVQSWGWYRCLESLHLLTGRVLTWATVVQLAPG